MERSSSKNVTRYPIPTEAERGQPEIFLKNPKSFLKIQNLLKKPKIFFKNPKSFKKTQNLLKTEKNEPKLWKNSNLESFILQ